jgi:hypothetical protein
VIHNDLGARNQIEKPAGSTQMLVQRQVQKKTLMLNQ